MSENKNTAQNDNIVKVEAYRVAWGGVLKYETTNKVNLDHVTHQSEHFYKIEDGECEVTDNSFFGLVKKTRKVRKLKNSPDYCYTVHLTSGVRLITKKPVL